MKVTRAAGINVSLPVFTKAKIEFSEHLAKRKSRRAFGRARGKQLTKRMSVRHI